MKTRILVWGLLLVTASSFAFTGDEKGNPADHLTPESGSAWFISRRGERHPKVCVSIAPDFGLAPEEALQIIRYAFVTWKHYMSTVAWMDITADARFLPSCDGSEDLQFLLGTENEHTPNGSAGSALSFAQRMSYDPALGWSKGFIWVAKSGQKSRDPYFPNWQIRNHLLGIILHEIGHVSGCGHVPGTIMDANIAETLKLGGDGVWRELQTIDQQRRLAPNWSVRGGDFEYRSSFFPKEAFERLVGRKAKGYSTSAKLSKVGTGTAPILTFFDDDKRYDFPIELVSTNHRGVNAPISIFKTALVDTYGQWQIGGEQDTSVLAYGSIVPLKRDRPNPSDRLALTFEFNLGPILRLTYFDEGQAYPLFESESQAYPSANYEFMGRLAQANLGSHFQAENGCGFRISSSSPGFYSLETVDPVTFKKRNSHLSAKAGGGFSWFIDAGTFESYWVQVEASPYGNLPGHLRFKYDSNLKITEMLLDDPDQACVIP